MNFMHASVTGTVGSTVRTYLSYSVASAQIPWNFFFIKRQNFEDSIATHRSEIDDKTSRKKIIPPKI